MEASASVLDLECRVLSLFTCFVDVEKMEVSQMTEEKLLEIEYAEC